jgi:hypothetical protein
VPGGNLHPESVYICKSIEEAPGVAFDFTMTRSRTTDFFVPATSLMDGQCERVASSGGLTFQVTATEAPMAGYVLDSIVRYNAEFASGAQPFVISSLNKQVITNSNSATGEASGSAGDGILRGSLMVFYNSPEPPVGLQGCTPGYWRQAHHYGNWTAPYTPNTLFSDVFDNAFPGRTLGQVVALGGGGLNALGRHTVAALLNAASGAVDYGIADPQDVIDAFNAVYPGSNSAYNTLKDQFEGYNEAGCPLGRAP